MAEYVAPWIDLNVHIVWKGHGRYTHAHDFNDGKLSYYRLLFKEDQIKAWFQQLNQPKVINNKQYERVRTRMTVTLTLFDNTFWVDAVKLREIIDAQFRKHRNEAPPLPHVPPKNPRAA